MQYCELSVAKTYAQNKMLEQFNKYCLQTKMKFPTIEWKPMGKRTAGLATYNEHKISLNSDYLQSKDWKNFLNETPLHELAHIVAYKIYGTAAHDKYWRKVCHAFGIAGERCHSFADPENARKSHVKTHTVHCKCMTHQISDVRYKRMKAGTKYICCKCGAELHE